MPGRPINKDAALQGTGTGLSEEMLGTAPREAEAARLPSRIVSIPLSQILPDRFQSRVILPPQMKEALFNGEIDCYETARRLLVAAEEDEALKIQVASLLALGDSILQDTQIEPATGRWVNTREGSRFLLEAGERRFWSLVLKAVEINPQEELRLRVVEQKETNRVRQISENLQREDLSAVDFSKAIASLILVLQNIEPAPGQTELDFFRQALEIRMPRGLWPEIKRVINLDRSYLYRHLQILKLDDELLYLASIYRLDEYRLREIVSAPAGKRHGMMRSAIEEKLTQADLARLAQSEAEGEMNKKSPTAPGPQRRAASRVKSLFKFLNQPSFDQGFDEVASELSALLRDPDELTATADVLERLAESLRKIRTRRS